MEANSPLGGSIAAGLTSGSIHDRVNNGYLNLGNFTTAPLVPASAGGDGTVTFFGNLGRNIYRGPFQQNGNNGFLTCNLLLYSLMFPQKVGALNGAQDIIIVYRVENRENMSSNDLPV